MGEIGAMVARLEQEGLDLEELIDCELEAAGFLALTARSTDALSDRVEAISGNQSEIKSLLKSIEDQLRMVQSEENIPENLLDDKEVKHIIVIEDDDDMEKMDFGCQANVEPSPSRITKATTGVSTTSLSQTTTTTTTKMTIPTTSTVPSTIVSKVPLVPKGQCIRTIPILPKVGTTETTPKGAGTPEGVIAYRTLKSPADAGPETVSMVMLMSTQPVIPSQHVRGVTTTTTPLPPKSLMGITSPMTPVTIQQVKSTTMSTTPILSAPLRSTAMTTTSAPPLHVRGATTPTTPSASTIAATPVTQTLSSTHTAATATAAANDIATPIPIRPSPPKFEDGTRIIGKRVDDLWYPGEIVKVATDRYSQVKFRVKFDQGNRGLLRSNHIALESCPPKFILDIGSRVVALRPRETADESATWRQAKEGPYGKLDVLYAGIVAEKSCPETKHRFLIFFDDGFAQYLPLHKLHHVYHTGDKVWNEVAEHSQEFIQEYLEDFPNRPMVVIKAHQWVKTEWRGKWLKAKVLEVDCSLVKMLFQVDNRTEWIYRGSTRLEPLYKALIHGNMSRKKNKRQRKPPVDPNEPYVDFNLTKPEFGFSLYSKTHKDQPPQPPPQQQETMDVQTSTQGQQQSQTQSMSSSTSTSTVQEQSTSTPTQLNTTTTPTNTTTITQPTPTTTPNDTTHASTPPGTTPTQPFTRQATLGVPTSQNSSTPSTGSIDKNVNAINTLKRLASRVSKSMPMSTNITHIESTQTTINTSIRSVPATNSNNIGSTPTANSTSIGSTPTANSISNGSTPTANSTSIGSMPTANSISIGSTPTANSISIGSTPTANSISIRSTPTAKSISVGSTPTTNITSSGSMATVRGTSLGSTPSLRSTTKEGTLTTSSNGTGGMVSSGSTLTTNSTNTGRSTTTLRSISTEVTPTVGTSTESMLTTRSTSMGSMPTVSSNIWETPAISGTSTGSTPTTGSTSTGGMSTVGTSTLVSMPATRSIIEGGMPNTRNTSTGGTSAISGTSTGSMPATKSFSTGGMPMTKSTIAGGIPTIGSTSVGGIPTTKSTIDGGMPTTGSTRTGGIPTIGITSTGNTPSSSIGQQTTSAVKVSSAAQTSWSRGELRNNGRMVSQSTNTDSSSIPDNTINTNWSSSKHDGRTRVNHFSEINYLDDSTASIIKASTIRKRTTAGLANKSHIRALDMDSDSTLVISGINNGDIKVRSSPKKIWDAPWKRNNHTTNSLKDAGLKLKVSHLKHDPAALIQEHLQAQKKLARSLKVMPELQPLIPKPPVLGPHKCGKQCGQIQQISKKEKSKHNVFSLPLLLNWKREITQRHPRSKKEIYYRAPCNKRLRSIEDVGKYLTLTGTTNVTVDQFSLDPEIKCSDTLINSDNILLPDISHGEESTSISVVNEHDISLPPPIDYVSDRILSDGVHINTDLGFLACCDCTDNCQDKTKCSCAQLTISASAAVDGKVDNTVGYEYRRLMDCVPTGIYECNQNCACSGQCFNRVVQHGIQLRLQVFKTENRGWGLQTLDDIPMGTFICTYSGQIMNEDMANKEGRDFGDEYLAELDHIEVVEKIKEGYESSVSDLEDDSVILKTLETGHSTSDLSDNGSMAGSNMSDSDSYDSDISSHSSEGYTSHNKNTKLRRKSSFDDAVRITEEDGTCFSVTMADDKCLMATSSGKSIVLRRISESGEHTIKEEQTPSTDVQQDNHQPMDTHSHKDPPPMPKPTVIDLTSDDEDTLTIKYSSSQSSDQTFDSSKNVQNLKTQSNNIENTNNLSTINAIENAKTDSTFDYNFKPFTDFKIIDISTSDVGSHDNSDLAGDGKEDSDQSKRMELETAVQSIILDDRTASPMEISDETNSTKETKQGTMTPDEVACSVTKEAEQETTTTNEVTCSIAKETKQGTMTPDEVACSVTKETKQGTMTTNQVTCSVTEEAEQETTTTNEVTCSVAKETKQGTMTPDEVACSVTKEAEQETVTTNEVTCSVAKETKQGTMTPDEVACSVTKEAEQETVTTNEVTCSVAKETKQGTMTPDEVACSVTKEAEQETVTTNEVTCSVTKETEQETMTTNEVTCSVAEETEQETMTHNDVLCGVTKETEQETMTTNEVTCGVTKETEQETLATNEVMCSGTKETEQETMTPNEVTCSITEVTKQETMTTNQVTCSVTEVTHQETMETDPCLRGQPQKPNDDTNTSLKALGNETSSPGDSCLGNQKSCNSNHSNESNSQVASRHGNGDGGLENKDNAGDNKINEHDNCKHLHSNDNGHHEDEGEQQNVSTCNGDEISDHSNDKNSDIIDSCHGNDSNMDDSKDEMMDDLENSGSHVDFELRMEIDDEMEFPEDKEQEDMQDDQLSNTSVSSMKNQPSDASSDGVPPLMSADDLSRLAAQIHQPDEEPPTLTKMLTGTRLIGDLHDTIAKLQSRGVAIDSVSPEKNEDSMQSFEDLPLFPPAVNCELDSFPPSPASSESVSSVSDSLERSSDASYERSKRRERRVNDGRRARRFIVTLQKSGVKRSASPDGLEGGPFKRPSTRSLFDGEEHCYVIDAKAYGNCGRYLNHSCSPNLFVQNVFIDTHDLRFPRVAFFAQHNISAGSELTWDYMYEVGSVQDKVLRCYCGSSQCRGRLL